MDFIKEVRKLIHKKTRSAKHMNNPLDGVVASVSVQMDNLTITAEVFDYDCHKLASSDIPYDSDAEFVTINSLRRQLGFPLITRN